MSMRSRFFALALLSFFAFAQSALSLPIQSAEKLKNYISLDLEYTPYQTLLKKLETKVGPLNNRGEAHITIITPPEFKELLNHYTAAEIHAKADAFLKTSPTFKQICIGEGRLKTKAKNFATYYVVLSSPEMLQFRKQFASKSSLFNAEKFYPHITLGFSVRDLHLEDGVVKDQSTCLKDIEFAL